MHGTCFSMSTGNTGLSPSDSYDREVIMSALSWNDFLGDAKELACNTSDSIRNCCMGPEL